MLEVSTKAMSAMVKNMENLNDIMPKDNEQADISKLEKEHEPKEGKKFVAMCESQISCISTNSPEIKRAFALIGYEFYDNEKKAKEPCVKADQKVIIPTEYLESFLKEMRKVKISLLRLEGMEVSHVMELHVANDKPLKVVMRLEGETMKDKDEVVFWLAPRVETA